MVILLGSIGAPATRRPRGHALSVRDSREQAFGSVPTGPNGLEHTRNGRVQARQCRVLTEPPSAGCFGGVPPPSRPPGRTRLTLPHSTAAAERSLVAIFARGPAAFCAPRTWGVGLHSACPRFTLGPDGGSGGGSGECSSQLLASVAIHGPAIPHQALGGRWNSSTTLPSGSFTRARQPQGYSVGC